MTAQRFRGRPVGGDESPRWLLARTVRATLGRLLLAAYRVRLEGWEHIPDGGAILAGNHVSYLDPALLWCVTPRPVHFVAKAELWQHGWLGYLLDRFWAVPVKRETADREMISTAARLLEAGDLVGMFPEGTRKRDHETDELGPAHGGVAFLALRTGVPVVPVGIAGTAEALPAGSRVPRFPRVTIRMGAPLAPEEFEGTRKARVDAMTERLMRRITEVRDEARGTRGAR